MSFSRLQFTIATLALSMMLATTVAPPGLRHWHRLDEHDLSHREYHACGHAAQSIEHGHLHYHRAQLHEPERHQHAAGVHEIIENSAEGLWHVHVLFLGYPMTLPDPLPQDDDQSNDDPTYVSLRSWGELILDEMPATRVFERIDAANRLPFPDVVPKRASYISTSSPDRPILLCDRARRERTGVLLA